MRTHNLRFGVGDASRTPDVHLSLGHHCATTTASSQAAMSKEQTITFSGSQYMANSTLASDFDVGPAGDVDK